MLNKASSLLLEAPLEISVETHCESTVCLFIRETFFEGFVFLSVDNSFRIFVLITVSYSSQKFVTNCILFVQSFGEWRIRKGVKFCQNYHH